MALALEFDAAGGIGQASAFVISAVDAGFGSAPDLVNGLIRVDLDAVEKHTDHRLFGELATLKTRGAENDVVTVPLAGAFINFVGRSGFIDNCSHAVLGSIPIEDLDFKAVLQINPAVATFLAHEKFDVQPEIPIAFLVTMSAVPYFSPAATGSSDIKTVP